MFYNVCVAAGGAAAVAVPPPVHKGAAGVGSEAVEEVKLAGQGCVFLSFFLPVRLSRLPRQQDSGKIICHLCYSLCWSLAREDVTHFREREGEWEGGKQGEIFLGGYICKNINRNFKNAWLWILYVSGFYCERFDFKHILQQQYEWYLIKYQHVSLYAYYLLWTFQNKLCLHRKRLAWVWVT